MTPVVISRKSMPRLRLVVNGSSDDPPDVAKRVQAGAERSSREAG